MLLVYARYLRNATGSLTLYEKLYPERRQPWKRYFQSVEGSLRNHGSSEKLSSKSSGVTRRDDDSEIGFGVSSEEIP